MVNSENLSDGSPATSLFLSSERQILQCPRRFVDYPSLGASRLVHMFIAYSPTLKSILKCHTPHRHNLCTATFLH